eukprot:1598842-Amphidinium_carterae.1
MMTLWERVTSLLTKNGIAKGCFQLTVRLSEHLPSFDSDASLVVVLSGSILAVALSGMPPFHASDVATQAKVDRMDSSQIHNSLL